MVLITSSQGASSVPIEVTGAFGTPSAVSWVSTQVAVTVSKGQTVFVTGTTEIGPTSTFGGDSMQLFVCFQSTAGGAITPFSDEPAVTATSASPNGRIGGPIQLDNVRGLFEFARQGAQQFPNGGSFNFGLCGVEFFGGTSGGAWVSQYTDNDFNALHVGWSKVVAMVVQ